jgi:hypothetical protein
MLKALLVLFLVLAATSLPGSAQPVVHVVPPNLQGPRPLPDQTAKAAIRDYLESWKSMSSALEQNRPDMLDPAFVGVAREKLAGAIQEQAALGIRTGYLDRSHEIQIVFYSPEGLSIELVDKVQYDVQVIENQQVKTIQHVSARYIIVMTPAEVRWRVRVFQADLE